MSAGVPTATRQVSATRALVFKIGGVLRYRCAQLSTRVRPELCTEHNPGRAQPTVFESKDGTREIRSHMKPGTDPGATEIELCCVALLLCACRTMSVTATCIPQVATWGNRCSVSRCKLEASDFCQTSVSIRGRSYVCHGTKSRQA